MRLKFWKKQFSKRELLLISNNYWRQSDEIDLVGKEEVRRAHARRTREWQEGYKFALSEEMLRVAHLITTTRSGK